MTLETAYGVDSALNVIVLFSIEGSVNSPGHCRGGSLRGYKRLAVHFNLIPCLAGSRISQQSAGATG